MPNGMTSQMVGQHHIMTWVGATGAPDNLTIAITVVTVPVFLRVGVISCHPVIIVGMMPAPQTHSAMSARRINVREAYPIVN